ncbi:TPA: ATP-binding protein [Pseudomonas aeruginosa]|uniref:ATP-binding protein n=1 Tax=Pseudomonas aeruginosa TaxID=287 RepID=UPI001A3060DC|nr:ATP-binding protein [Pseudomonas aeruginosa]MBH3803097.1 ATP-binding protein [Pseudomonas aeruginosa]HBO0340286.1 ATP-binding protein [Pseudomonas aeruginosa]HBP0352670.1 ATP-binding protein [Pseudomonas aeruginosa]HCT7924475.1 ATP-binding protein [Pseudomonas aeruginosa]HEH6393047.1 ATP-binding protein [Pseudomonas aeruginosa]
MAISVGEVIAVSGVRITLRIFEDSNQETLFHDGVKYRGVSIREHLLIQRGFIDIVCLVEGEYLDERKLDETAENTVYVRKVDVRPIGYVANHQFYEGVKYMPMIRDRASLLSEEMVGKIYGVNDGASFTIGAMLKENVPISLPWTRLFNSHLGIFGNTGSGKSNTLAKLYTTLFREKLEGLKGKSQFVIIDFNGEYTGGQILATADKKVTILDSKKGAQRFTLESAHFWDAETLSLLFQATTNTQAPFLRRVLSGREKFKDIPLAHFLVKTFERVFAAAEPKPEALELTREVARIVDSEALQYHLAGVKYHAQYKYFRALEGHYYDSDGQAFAAFLQPFLAEHVKLEALDQFDELLLRCYLQLSNDVVMGYAQYEHIQPVLARARSSLSGLRNVLHIVDDAPPPDLLHVISLKKCKNDVKKILPMLIAKNFYVNHKEAEGLNSPPTKTLHLIIDEAHNILSEQSTREHEIWKDYRLELFEEIIKEGRKYGVYLTLSSQRPADISPTIVSQIHNFFIHRLVNERDLMLLDNTISTLDTSSKSLIPTLAKGCCVLTGTAFDLPMILKVDPLLEGHRPASDDVNLDALWETP